jgi:hypothetical protein
VLSEQEARGWALELETGGLRLVRTHGLAQLKARASFGAPGREFRNLKVDDVPEYADCFQEKFNHNESKLLRDLPSWRTCLKLYVTRDARRVGLLGKI